MPDEKLPPHDIDAEEAVVGSILMDGDCISEVAGIIKPSDFFREKNAWVYAAAIALYQAGTGIDQTTVAHQLGADAKLDSIGGPAYLIHVLNSVPTSLHVRHYAGVVKRCSEARKLISVAGRIAGLGYSEEPDGLSKSIGLLLENRNGHLLDVRSPKDLGNLALSLYAEATGDKPRSTPYGLLDLDKITGGMRPGELTIVGARPSMGKTTFLLQVAEVVAESGQPTLFGSVEMSDEALLMRRVSRLSHIPIRRLYEGGPWDEDESTAIQGANAQIAETKLWTRAGRGLDTSQLRAAAMQVQLRAGALGLIVVDYLQILADSGHSANERLTAITAALKTLAEDLQCPVLAASQLNRAVEGRDSKRPSMADLRDSGAIEQDADVVLFMYRDDYYFSPDAWKKVYPGRTYPRGVVEFGLAKHRQFGTEATSMARVLWRDDMREYVNLSQEG